jgi:hypothetical protein
MNREKRTNEVISVTFGDFTRLAGTRSAPSVSMKDCTYCTCGNSNWRPEKVVPAIFEAFEDISVHFISLISGK